MWRSRTAQRVAAFGTPGSDTPEQLADLLADCRGLRVAASPPGRELDVISQAASGRSLMSIFLDAAASRRRR